MSAPGPQTYTNTIVAGATWTQGGFTQSTSAASATLNVFSGFRGFKSILDPRTGSSLTGGVVPGDVVRYRVELENFSTGQITGVSLTDPFPSIGGAQMVYATAATPGAANPRTNCTATGTPVFTISAERDRLQVGGITVPARAAGAQSGQCQVSFAVVAPVPATWNNSATATGTDARTGETVSPPGPANATLVTTPSLTATKSFSPTPVAANGGNSTVTVTLGNIGAAVLTNVSVNDPLPSGLRVASTPAAATTCAGPTAITANAGASSAQLTGATLPAGTTCTFTFNVVTQAAPNPVVNTIP
ncbi:MAG: hypothetical protein ACK54L_11610, partial [Betaproteobacteria bacterium]